jgi:hypothetical protein
MSGVVLCNLPDVRRVEDAGNLLNMRRKGTGGVVGKKRYIYLGFYPFLVDHVLFVTNTKQLQQDLPQPTGRS